jgi:hypothetical protein
MTNREAVIKAVTVLTTTFNRTSSVALIEGYVIGLASLTPGQVTSAAATAIARCKFMPTPAELREFVAPARSIEERATIAWGAVREAMRKHDYTVASIDFGPLVNTVIRTMGGWEWLCEQTRDALVWRQKEFTRYFEAFASGPAEALRAEPLEGWGRGRVGCDRAVVAIAGEAAPARLALEAPVAAGARALGTVVRDLAEQKSQAGVAENSHSAQSAGPPPPRENRRPVEPITEAEKASAIARMEAQLAARAAQAGGS